MSDEYTIQVNEKLDQTNKRLKEIIKRLVIEISDNRSYIIGLRKEGNYLDVRDDEYDRLIKDIEDLWTH